MMGERADKYSMLLRLRYTVSYRATYIVWWTQAVILTFRAENSLLKHSSWPVSGSKKHPFSDTGSDAWTLTQELKV